MSTNTTIYYQLNHQTKQYAIKEFGTCPLVQCAGQPVLPVGIKDEVGAHTVKIFCPKCQCVYHPPPVRSRSNHHGNIGSGGSTGVDGASIGTTFPHLFLMTFSNLMPDPLPVDSAYIPRVFGFRVHQSARQAPAAAIATASPTQMIVVNRAIDDESKDSREGRSRNVDLDVKAEPSAFTTSKTNDADDATRSSKGSKRSSRQLPGEVANGNEEEDRKRKAAVADDRTGDKDENGVNESSSVKRRKRTEKDT